MSRSSVRAGSALLALVATLLAPAAARADDAAHLWFAGTRLILDHPAENSGEIAVGTADSGLARFLGRVGATLAWDTAQRNIVVTAADRRVIRFTIGDTRYTVAGSWQSGVFAPYVQGNEAFLPFYALARALAVERVQDAGDIVLQPQAYGMDVKASAKSVTVTIKTATPTRFKKVEDGERLMLTLQGVSSTLDAARTLNAPGLNAITVIPGGSARAPTAAVSFESPAGSTRVLAASASPNAIALVFAAPGTPLAGDPVPETYAATATPVIPIAVTGPAASVATAAPGLPPPDAVPGSAAAGPAAAASPGAAAIVTAVDETQVGDGVSIRIAVGGGASFEWHRLIDNRFYVDIKNAVLGFPPRDDAPNSGAVESVRIRQIATVPVGIVRVAITMPSQRQVDVLSIDGGIALAVNGVDDLAPPRVGAGEINGGFAYAAPQAAPLPLPPMLTMGSNSKLIVLDPGHGGSDTGAMHNGLVEKDLTLDISRRLKAILIARGWTVRMTRETDVDVFAPNDSARDELQARCDVANNAGARLFVSVHINSSTAASVNGTTTYYYKPEDLQLGDAIHRRLMESLGTRDMGVRKEAFYVIKHTVMPAVLVETAFISNPSDADLMRSPAFLQRVALSIADGIGDYTGTGASTGTSQ